jgi:hypothetical protein
MRFLFAGPEFCLQLPTFQDAVRQVWRTIKKAAGPLGTGGLIKYIKTA